MMPSMAGAAIWAVIALLVWVLVVAAAAWATVRVIHPHRQAPPTLPSPLDVLEHSLADGKITHAEFDKARARLRKHELDV